MNMKDERRKPEDDHHEHGPALVRRSPSPFASRITSIPPSSSYYGLETISRRTGHVARKGKLAD